MAHKFDNTSGRVSSASPNAAYNPGQLNQVKSTEPAKVLYGLNANKMGPPETYIPFAARVTKLKELFQSPTGVGIHLKGGAKDQLLYFSSLIMGTVGFSYVVYRLAKMAYPQKK